MASMVSRQVGRSCLYRRQLPEAYRPILDGSILMRPTQFASPIQLRLLHRRTFSCSRCIRQEQRQKDQTFSARLGKAWRETKIEWKPIPVGLGIGFLGFLQFLRVRQRHDVEDADGQDRIRPPKRERIRPTGGWQVQVMSTLPLKALSRIWGRFNELKIPYYLRVPGFKLYGWIFGVNFAEVAESDLHAYPNLASFFYRSLKPGVRPLDPNQQALLSPADGKVLQFGIIEGGEVEQVKGVTYSLDALLGRTPPTPPNSPNSSRPPSIHETSSQGSQSVNSEDRDAETVSSDEEFANMNGISYTLPNLFSGHRPSGDTKSTIEDASTTPRPSSEAEVSASLSESSPWWSPFSPQKKPSQLYYLVVYLAPGDYHRFHSPVPWVCQTRRHFAGELYSVSPYLQRTLPGLFTLNERVVLLGRWKYGFFSYTSVGATNVGSIKINFDRELRTNSLTTDTEADREAERARQRGETYAGFSEASYAEASRLLGGHALRRGEEMGGFQLGSSIVLVFEAPTTDVKETGEGAGTVTRGWRWNVEKGQKVQMGQALGWVEEETTM